MNILIGFSRLLTDNTFISQLAIIVRVTTSPFPVIKRFKDEEYFEDTFGRKSKFPSIDDDPTIELSVIIPAYEEEKRLPVMLDECTAFLEQKVKENSKFTYEIIVVSDGSKDKTVETAMKYCKKFGTDKFRVLELIENRGKGGAVRLVRRLLCSKFLILIHYFRGCKAVVVASYFSQMPMVQPNSATTRSLKIV